MSVQFDKTDDFISVNDSASISLTGNISISAWINIVDFSVYSGIVGKVDSPTPLPAPFDFYVVATGEPALTGRLRLYRGDGGGSLLRLCESGIAVSTGVWVHVLVTNTNDGVTYHFYIDGTETTGTPLGVGTNFSDNGLAMYIGNRTTGDIPFNGHISEVAIWNSILTAAEALQLAKCRIKGMPLQIQKANLVGYWPLDDQPNGTSGDGDTFKDLSGNGNNGTGNDGANNTGLTCKAEEILTYPCDPWFINFNTAAQVFTEDLAFTVISVLADIDIQNYLESQSLTSISDITLADLQAYLESLTTDVPVNLTGQDLQNYLDNNTITVVSDIVLSDLQNYIENNSFTIQSDITLIDLKAYVEFLDTDVPVDISDSDIQNYIDNNTITITSTVTDADLQTYFDGLSFTIVSDITESDIQNYIEGQNFTIVSDVTVTDDKIGSGEGLSFTIVSEVTATDIKSHVENLDLIGIIDVSISETIAQIEFVNIIIQALVEEIDTKIGIPPVLRGKVNINVHFKDTIHISVTPKLTHKVYKNFTVTQKINKEFK